MQHAKRYGSRGESARGRSPRDRLLDEELATAVTVVRRLGFVLGVALEACEKSLLNKGFHETASVLRDGVKPLVDALIHFEIDEVPNGDDDGPL